MPFSLSLYLYRLFQEKVQKEFERKNKILDLQGIENLLVEPDKERRIKIFKSAIVDHEPVDGIPYYLMPPIAPLFYHDNFKRCLIANAIGKYAGSLNYEQSKDVILILDTLRGFSSAGYVQIFAWDALGQWAIQNPEFFDFRKDDLLKAFGGCTASLLGALLFLSKMRLTYQERKVSSLIDEGRERVLYKVQKALLGYFLVKNKYCLDSYYKANVTDSNMQDFLNKCRSQKFGSHYDFEEGAGEIGLISKSQKDGLQAGTQQADIGCQLKVICGDYLSAIGFYLNTYWK